MNKGLRSEFLPTAFFLCLFGIPLVAHAQNVPGVTEKTVVIGSCAALEGPSHSLGVETVTGANAYFSLINDEGGVSGRKLKLISSTTATIQPKRRSVSSACLATTSSQWGFSWARRPP